MKKINNCENCSGYGEVLVFLAEDVLQTEICEVCKGKPSAKSIQKVKNNGRRS